MRTRRAILLAVSLAACGTSPSGRVPAPSGPVALDGLSVSAPPGGGWTLAESKPGVVVFERRDAGGTVLTALAAVFPYTFEDLDECRASLHRDTYVETATQRNPQGSVRLVADADPPHVLVRYGVDEADRPGPDASWVRLTSEFRWYLRPGDRRAVMLSFAERRPAGAAPVEYGAQAALFFGSLRFD